MRRTAYLVSFENIRLSLDFSFLLASCSLLAGTVSILPSHPGTRFSALRASRALHANAGILFTRMFTSVLGVYSQAFRASSAMNSRLV